MSMDANSDIADLIGVNIQFDLLDGIFEKVGRLLSSLP